MNRWVIFLLSILVSFGAKSQTCDDFAVQLSAQTQTTPPAITLNWKRLPDSTQYTVFKKAKATLTWPTAPIATLATIDSTYKDTAVIVDSAYEYLVIGDHRLDTTHWVATGYIYAGIKCPPIHNKGAIVVLVDSFFRDTCAAALSTYLKDLSGDGWQVLRHDIGRGQSDTTVKSIIHFDYTHVANVKAVQLLGHIPVPYSGDLNPDGHPNHLGAWPADRYYADMTVVYTDVTVNDTSAGYPANYNRPGDGKWDQTQITTFSELQIGRVDFYDMPAFAATENAMMNSYLNRAHLFKMDSLSIRRRALISDNFGVFRTYFSGSWYYEAFASCGWRNFPTLVGRDSFGAAPYISSLNSGSYLWSYGCGGGWFQGAGGIGTTDSFAANNFNGIFTMLFGSYFGDWNVTNSFLRAPLCSPVPALTNCWAGRPYWFFHHMALGENIGFSAWLSQNNDGNLYGPGSIYGIQQWVHEALMGDLSLRSDYIKKPSNLTITTAPHNGSNLTWTASPDAGVLGYFIYRSDTGEFGRYNLLNKNMVTGTTFHDTVGHVGLKYYMVRPVKLQTTPSGNYYNLGIGITDSATVSYATFGLENLVSAIECSVYPNPAAGQLNVTMNSKDEGIVEISIVGVNGATNKIATKNMVAGENKWVIPVDGLAPGIYQLVISAGATRLVRSWEKL